MNKILISKDNLENFTNNDLSITNNTITFKNNTSYFIEYTSDSNINLTINVEQNINVNLFIYSENIKQNVTNTFNIFSNSTLTIYKFSYNKDVKSKEIINLNEEGANIEYHFSNICDNSEFYNIVINHNAKNTNSNIINKSVTTKDDSNLSFTIDSVLPKGNTNCYLDQQTRIITLKNGDAKIEPNMFIEEDDVIAKHGSVIGKFDDEQLFYLESRGIKETDAINLLIRGLLLSNINTSDDYLEKIMKIINKNWR